MEIKFSTILLYFGKYQKFQSLKKSEVFKSLQELTDQLWFEFSFAPKTDKNLIKYKKLKTMVGSGKIEFFLGLIHKKEKGAQMVLEKYFNNFHKKKEDFFIISTDEYLNGRKKGIIFNFCHFQWGKDFWRNLEKSFETFLFFLTKNSEIVSILFFLLESIRYDKLFMFSEEKKRVDLISFLTDSKTYFFTQSHKALFGFLMKFLPFLFSVNFDNRKSLELQNLSLKMELGIFFEKKAITVRKFMKIGNLFFHRGSLGFLRDVYNFLSRSGLINFDVFWVKKPSRSLNNLFSKTMTGNLEKELFHFEKVSNQKKFPGKLHSKNQNWQYKIKKNKTCNLMKNAFIFGTGVINFRTKRYSFLYENSLELEKIQIWTKFMLGCFFSLVNSGSNRYYENFPLLLENEGISDYLKGGILFGMGLNLKDSWDKERFFVEKCKYLIKNKNEPAIKFGACLGLGLNGRGFISKPKKSLTYSLIKNLITTDCLAGEGAALSIGFLFTGTSSSVLLEDIILLVQEIDHQRIRKTLFLSLGLIFLGRKDESDRIFDKLILEKNPQIRQGAISIYSLAYIMTGDILATKKLLKIISNDPDDNVKRSTVIGLGFIFFSKHELIGEIFLQLTEHYNPFVRYGVCFGLVLSSFKLPRIEKIHFLLEKLSNDKIDFVRQGAFISLGLTFFGSISSDRKKKVKKIFKKAIESNSGTPISKFGSYIGSSLIELSEKFKQEKIFSEKNFLNLTMGLFLFINYWDWIPNLLYIFFLFSN